MISSIAEIRTAKRVVVKVGSSSISGENVHQIPVIVDALAALHASGCEVVLVTSGAIASGLVPLNLVARPDDLPSQQAAAAVGQNILMNRWQDALDRFDILAGQVLLTAGDMENVESRTNARAAMDRLLELRAEVNGGGAKVSVNDLVVLAVAVVVSVWATRPPEVSMPRHVLALIGDAVLDVVRTALRAVVWVAVVVGLLVASWSYAGPRIAAGTAHLRDDAVAAVTPSLDLPSIHLPWRTEP